MGFLRTRSSANDTSPEASGTDDATLVARAQHGDAQAFALLYRRYLDPVYDFCARRLESREAAEDATQTIFLKAVASLPQCRDGDRFAGWLFGIARNVITDNYRSNRFAAQPLDSAPEFEDPGLSPERLAEQAVSARYLAALRDDCLNDAERELLDLRLNGLNGKQIAEAIGPTHGAVRTAQYRMVQKLRDCIELPSTPFEWQSHRLVNGRGDSEQLSAFDHGRFRQGRVRDQLIQGAYRQCAGRAPCARPAGGCQAPRGVAGRETSDLAHRQAAPLLAAPVGAASQDPMVASRACFRLVEDQRSRGAGIRVATHCLRARRAAIIGAVRRHSLWELD